MDVNQLRGISRGHFLQHGTFSLTEAHFLTARLKTLSRVSKTAIASVWSLISMLPGAGYIAGRLREVRDRKIVRCMSFHEVHECHREPGIIHGYRSENCSVIQAVLSLFHVTNETTNFWTHFLPSLYFVWLFFSLALLMPLFTDQYLLPFVCYMVAACAYLLMSCLAHAFSCLSLTATHVFFFMDYATLSLYSWGAGVLYYSYSFPQLLFTSIYGKLFLPVAAILAVITTLMACLSRFLPSRPSSSKALRLGAFVIPYMWVSLPLVLRIVNCDQYGDCCERSGLHHTRQFLGVFLASFFYATHIPERFAPGRFDFVGHSHNFLHLFGVAATHEQLQGALIDIECRRDTLEALQWSTPMTSMTVVSPLIVFINIAIIAEFTRRLKTNDFAQKQKDK